VKCEAICPTAEAWKTETESCHRTTIPKTQQQIYNRMTEKEKNQGVAITQTKARPEPDCCAVVGPQESCG